LEKENGQRAEKMSPHVMVSEEITRINLVTGQKKGKGGTDGKNLLTTRTASQQGG